MDNEMEVRPGVEPFRVVVTGGRDYHNIELIWSTLTNLVEEHGALQVIQGGARGADTVAKRWAETGSFLDPVNIPIPITYAAEWDKYGRKAGMLRNRRMLDESHPDLVVAFPGGGGTAGCVMEARKRKIPVMTVEDSAQAETPTAVEQSTQEVETQANRSDEAEGN